MEDPDGASPQPAMDDPAAAASLHAAMEVPITASLGPTGPLLRKLHSLMAPEHSLPDWLTADEIRLLREGLKELCFSLKDLSEAEDASFTAKWWMKMVRELCYDTEDHLDEVTLSGAGAHQVAYDFSELIARVEDASERFKRFQLFPKTIKPDCGEAGVSGLTPQLSLEPPVPISVHVDTGGCSVVGVEEPMNKLVNLLAFDDDNQKQLKVVPIFGFAGVGKTTVARTLYHKYGGKFQCRAFVGVSRNPDMRRLLTSILSQIKAPRPHGFPDVTDLIDGIRKHLQGKRYFIITDDLWTASAWDIISRAFPHGDYCSRIITTTQIDDVAMACCSYYSEHIYKISPLNDDESRKLFFGRVFGSEDGCPTDIKEVSYEIIRKCGGLPLAIVNIASLLASEPNIVRDKWKNVQDSLSSTSEGMKDVLNVIYNNLPPRLKTCLLYLSMYPEGYPIGKHDLVKQWIAEGFLSAVEGRDIEKLAEGYFDELVSRGMVQAVDTNYNDEVLSCTVHHVVLDLIRHKSMQENFIISVDYFQSTLALPDKVRRLSVQFGGAKGARISESIILSQIRSLCGFFECVPSIVDYGLLRVLILHIWDDQEEIFDLTRIDKLFRLRYLKIECNLTIKLPAEIAGLQYLETLEIDARLSAVPSDIVHLEKLLHLRLPSESNLPRGVDCRTSLRTLGYFDLGSNSEDNVMNLGKLTNLQDLQLTYSVVQPADNLENNMKCLGSILGKLRILRCLTLVPAAGSSHVNTLQNDAGASSMSISCDGLSSVSPVPVLLERLELPRVCIFPSLPMWFRDLNKLCILKIAVRELSRENIDILKGLHALTALSLYVWITPTGGIVFGEEGFRALRYFKFTCTTPCLTFEKDAMPNVQRLKLRFNANSLEQYDPVHAGFEHLLGLKEISAKIGSVGADEYDSIAALWMNIFSKLPSSPIFNMQSVDRIVNGDREKSSATNEEKQQTTETVQDASKYVIQDFAGEGTSKQADSGTSVASGSSLQIQILGPQQGSLVRGATLARAGMDVALGAVKWVVGKALAPVADGVLEAWGASKNFGLNVEALKMELLLVQTTLEIASGKQLGGQAMEKLLQKLQDSAHDAEDLLDELDYFRIHDGLHGTYDAADEQPTGGVHNLVFNAGVTAKAVGKQLGLSAIAWPRARKRARDNSSSSPNANQADEEVSGRKRKLGKLIPRSSFPHVHDDDETPKQGFNRVDVSKRMKHIVEQLQPVRRELTTILQSCGRNTVPDTAQSCLSTTDRSMEPKLYGRDYMVNGIIHDITKGKYYGKDPTVLPIVGPEGIGKTTMIQHIYHNQEVQTHFQVRIWVCVSLSFNLNKILEEIEKQIPRVKGEKEGRPEELIEQRLKSKRFLLVLDDIWECSNGDDWDRLLLPLKRSQEKGSMILVTTRLPAVAQMVKTTNHSIELEGLESEEFRKLFFAFVFGDEQCRRDHIFLLDTGDKIMEKLKGSPLAAKNVGRLLRKDLSLLHWRRVLESKEWERQTGNNEIMPALKLRYDYLPFHLQQCFSYSALFPENYHFTSSQLISLWIGLDILQPDAQKQTYEEIGLSNLNELVTHGFFREEEIDGRPCYVMHDLLHDLALKVASHECLSLHRSNVGSVQIQPCIRHLSIIIDDVGHDNSISGENFKSELRKLKTKLKVEHLQSLMLFGGMDESFASILGDLFREATALRVLHLLELPCPVESIIHNFSALVHLRYLCLGTQYQSQMHLPLTISKFYHLRILDLGSWDGSCDFPKDMSNLTNLCRFYTPSDELHSDIYNVGKLKLLEELKVFRINKESEGFELKQLEHLTELREVGIYNLEKIHTKEEAAEAKLIEKNNLQRLTLDWDSQRSSVEPDVEAMVLESLQPHRNLQELCISGHGGPSCPTWLGDELAVEALQSLHLVGVSWEVLPSLGKMWDLRELTLKHIATVKEFVIEQSFGRLIRLELVGLRNFEKWVPPQDAHLFPLLQVLIIRDCPKLLELPFSNHTVYPPEQNCNIAWFPKLQKLEIERCPEFSSVTPIPWTETLCFVLITDVKLLKEFVYSKSSDGVKLNIIGNDDLHSLDQVPVFNKETGLEELTLEKCPPLGLKHLLMLTSLKTLMVKNSDALVGPLGGQGDVEWQLPVEDLWVWDLCGATGRELTELLPHLPRLSSLKISGCKKITQLVVGVDLQKTTSTTSEVEEVEAAEAAAELTVEQEKEEDGVLLFPAHLSDSLLELRIDGCPDLVTKPTLLQALRALQRLITFGSPRFFAGWVLQGEEEGEKQQLQLPSPPSSSKLRDLRTNEAAGLLAAPICRLLSSSLTKLSLHFIKEMERFTEEQEDALHLLASLRELEFHFCNKLQHLPAGLHKLTNLKRLEVYNCPAVRSLPKDGLPKSLQVLNVRNCFNEELTQQCRGLVGTIPNIFY